MPKKEEKKLPEAPAQDEILVSDPEEYRPKELPLIIKLPESASLAQVEFAKVLNAYAYKNPTKWREKKDDRIVDGKVIKGLITQLKELKNAPDPVDDSKLSFRNKLLD